MYLKQVADKIKKEIKDVPTLKNKYPTLTQEQLLELHIPTLADLLALVSPKLSDMKLLLLKSSNIAIKTTYKQQLSFQISFENFL